MQYLMPILERERFQTKRRPLCVAMIYKNNKIYLIVVSAKHQKRPDASMDIACRES